MLKALLKFFMKILDKFTGLLLTPFISTLEALIPDFSSSVSAINSFLDVAFTYVTFSTEILLIPSGALILFMDYLLVKYSIYVLRLSIKLGIKTYNMFKI